MRTRVVCLLLAIIALPLDLLGVPRAGNGQAATADARAPDDRVVMVDGRRMRVRTAGLDHLRSGAPAIVFETGLQSPLEAWLGVPAEVSAFAPVVSYDRAGIGQSQSGGEMPVPSRASRTLHVLLAEIGVKPPYVLVGHSYGGLLLRSFAGLYPGEVAGLVFVDSTDARSEAESMEYYKARGYTEADVPKLRARLVERFRAPAAAGSLRSRVAHGPQGSLRSRAAHGSRRLMVNFLE